MNTLTVSLKGLLMNCLKNDETKTKVVIVSTVGLVYDGITNVILSCLQAMDLYGLEVYVIGTIDVQPSIQKKIEDLGCHVIHFASRRTNAVKYFLELLSFIRKNKITVVHAHGNSGTLAIEMVAAWLGGCKKRIAHSHNTRCNQVKADKLLRPIFNLFYTDALACGEEAGKWLFKNREFRIVNNGRDINLYKFDQEKREKYRKVLNIKDEIAIGHVGGFFEQKNHIFLVDIYREIKKIEPNAKLYMIGDGPLKKQIEQICKDIKVEFTGTVDNMSDYLNAMDGMILPSLFEGLPLVALEWQINGLPILMSDTITRECAISDNIKFYSLNNSTEDWAKTIISMTRSNNRILESENAERIAKEKGFDIYASAALLRKLYIQN